MTTLELGLLVWASFVTAVLLLVLASVWAYRVEARAKRHEEIMNNPPPADFRGGST